jgi:hypothetical protein
MITQLGALEQTVTAFATTIIALFVACIGYRQWKTNQEKLRLDLYNRRFDIFVRVLDYYQDIFAERSDIETHLQTRQKFIKAVRESRFLFPKSSSIHPHLEEMQMRATRYAEPSWGEKQKAESDYHSTAWDQLRLEDSDWLLNSMHHFENLIAPFMIFHKP